MSWKNINQDQLVEIINNHSFKRKFKKQDITNEMVDAFNSKMVEFMKKNPSFDVYDDDYNGPADDKFIDDVLMPVTLMNKLNILEDTDEKSFDINIIYKMVYDQAKEKIKEFERCIIKFIDPKVSDDKKMVIISDLQSECEKEVKAWLKSNDIDTPEGLMEDINPYEIGDINLVDGKSYKMNDGRKAIFMGYDGDVPDGKSYLLQIDNKTGNYSKEELTSLITEEYVSEHCQEDVDSFVNSATHTQEEADAVISKIKEGGYDEILTNELISLINQYVTDAHDDLRDSILSKSKELHGEIVVESKLGSNIKSSFPKLDSSSSKWVEDEMTNGEVSGLYNRVSDFIAKKLGFIKDDDTVVDKKGYEDVISKVAKLDETKITESKDIHSLIDEFAKKSPLWKSLGLKDMSNKNYEQYVSDIVNSRKKFTDWEDLENYTATQMDLTKYITEAVVTEAIKSVEDLKKSEEYKIDSGMGGVFRLKYIGQKNGKHHFISTTPFNKGSRFSFTNDEVLAKVSLSSIDEEDDKSEEELDLIPTFEEFCRSKGK